MLKNYHRKKKRFLLNISCPGLSLSFNEAKFHQKNVAKLMILCTKLLRLPMSQKTGQSAQCCKKRLLIINLENHILKVFQKNIISAKFEINFVIKKWKDQKIFFGKEFVKTGDCFLDGSSFCFSKSENLRKIFLLSFFCSRKVSVLFCTSAKPNTKIVSRNPTNIKKPIANEGPQVFHQARATLNTGDTVCLSMECDRWGNTLVQKSDLVLQIEVVEWFWSCKLLLIYAFENLVWLLSPGISKQSDWFHFWSLEWSVFN